MKLLLNVDYTNGTAKNGKSEFWSESSIKNTIVEQNENETIHETVKRILENEDFCEFSYKGKPQNDVYIDIKEGEMKLVGYVYRVKQMISDRHNAFEGHAYFDAWVTIKSVKELELISCE